MSAQTLLPYLRALRDRGFDLPKSWKNRYGSAEKPRGSMFEVWAITYLETLTCDDLLWALVAALQDTTVTHLQFCARRITHEPPGPIVDAIVDSFSALGVGQLNIAACLADKTEDVVIITMAVFSEAESSRAMYDLKQ